MSVQVHLMFLGCVLLATLAQNLTGFAFGLILLGMVATLNIISLADVAVVISFLTVANALATLGGPKPALDRSVLMPVLLSSLLGVSVGMWGLGALDEAQMAWLRLLLGCVIIIASLLLVVQSKPRERLSGQPAFWVSGALCGLLNGLFSSGGPPLVYHLYRQPLAYEVIRNTLITVFAANSATRLGLVIAQGQLHMQVIWLSLEALPLVLLVSVLMRRYPPRLSLRTVRWLVFALLVLAGASLIVESLGQVLAMAAKPITLPHGA
ncbi:sulfite exporter TauE/SafE family protein [Pseudomonas sp. MS19]|nr:sulfite exporter TauE/SafE family protein [Pseudomonas sp. MS19]NRH26351.1 sulfite exporter TauE/SafE family protein [Pseudomonas sp. MS19]